MLIAFVVNLSKYSYTSLLAHVIVHTQLQAFSVGVYWHYIPHNIVNVIINVYKSKVCTQQREYLTHYTKQNVKWCHSNPNYEHSLLFHYITIHLATLLVRYTIVRNLTHVQFRSVCSGSFVFKLKSTFQHRSMYHVNMYCCAMANYCDVRRSR